jgi:hypothetical protein
VPVVVMPVRTRVWWGEVMGKTKNKE